MVPPGYQGLVVCDSRRARQWRAGLAKLGLAPIVVDARSDAASCEVAVPIGEARPAQAFVTEVLQGKTALPAPPWLSPVATTALLAVVAILAAILATGWLASLLR